MPKIDQIKPFRFYSEVRVLASGIDDKKIMFMFYPENTTFIKTYNFLRIKPQFVKFVIVPSTKVPLTKLTNDYKKVLINHSLRPLRIPFGGYEKLPDKNLYFDYSIYMNAAKKRWKFTKYNAGKAFSFTKSMIDSMNLIPSEYEKILLYSIDLNSPIPEKLFFKKIFPIYHMLIESNKDESIKIPFDKVVLFIFNENQSRFSLIWDRKKKTSLSRFRQIILKIRNINLDAEEESDQEIIDDEVDKILDDDIDKDKVKNAIKGYIAAAPETKSKTPDEVDVNSLAASAVVYHSTGDIDKARLMNKVDKKTQTKIIKQRVESIIPKRKLPNVSTSPVISNLDVSKFIDNQSPAHIVDKRKKDFDEGLSKDIITAFSPLKKKPIPIKVSKLERKTLISPASELQKTIKDRYFIELIDANNNTHITHIDLPHLTENGTFLINGRNQVLVNQIITYPIFFFKPFQGRFSSVYSQMTIHSKQIKRGSYLMGYMGGYKVPMIELMSYMYGFEETLKKLKIKYKISETEDKLSSFTTKLPDKTSINFYFDENNEVARQYVNGLNYVKGIKSGDIKLKDFWRDTLSRSIGTRNCIYIIDQVQANIVTPIEIEVLKSKGDPTNLEDIIIYICEGVVDGRVDDRNSLEKQRIRTAEVFSELVSKQINMAYNEFLEKYRAGDENARIELHPTKVYSDVINSQNVQLLENINPVEEISMMIKCVPVGIGGVPDKQVIPESAMNIHRSYYGNIDPLETPDGPGVGILQHLTVGSMIVNDRGMFGVKDRANTEGVEILSASPALIPFVNSNDGNRVMMAAGQMKQAIPLRYSEPPAVQTGFESTLTTLLSDSFIKKSPIDGVVEKIEPTFMTIKDGKGGLHTIDLSPKVLKSGQGKDGISIFNSVVRVGQKVKKGSLVAEGSGVKNGTISTGINMLVAFMPWKGYNFEDAVVISESASKRFVSLHMSEESVYLAEDEDVIEVAKIGDVLEKGGIILTYSSAYVDVESFRHLRAPAGGRIVNIEVYSNLDTIPKKLEDAYNKTKIVYKSLNGKYPQGSFKEKDEKFEGILVKVTLSQESHLVKGNKMNNRHFNKGVVSIIEKDENMPITPWGERVEMILNPLGIINRMNIGQVLELHVGLISRRLAMLMKTKSRKDFMNLLERVLKFLDRTDGSIYSKSSIQMLNSLSDKGYSEITEKISNNRFFTIIIPPFKNPSKEDIEKAMKLVGVSPTSKLRLPEFNRDVDNVAVGYILEQQLEHMAEKKLSTRSSGSAYTTKTMAPSGGKGRSQKVGENDLYSLLAWDVPIITEEFFGPLSSDHVAKNQLISQIIQKGSSEFIPSKSTPEKELLKQYMLAINLES